MEKNKTKGITRRDFIKGAAAGAAGLVGANLLSGCQNTASVPASAKIFNEPEKWDYECDVVVIGSGTAS